MCIYKENLEHICYTYLIGWSEQNMFYYGRRTAKGCNPREFWVKYFTSSKYVKEFRKEHGDPDIIELRKIFSNIQACIEWETKVLKRLNAAKRKNFLNQTNGDKNFDYITKDKKTFYIMTPDGIIKIIDNLNEYCLINNLNISNILNCAANHKRHKHHKKFQIRRENDDTPFLDPKSFEKDIFIIKHPDGNLTVTKDLFSFAKKYNLYTGTLYAICNGKLKSTNGFQIRKKSNFFNFYTESELNETNNGKTFIIKSPQSEIIQIKNLRKFCAEKNLPYSSMIDVIRKKIKHYQFWQCRSLTNLYDFYTVEDLKQE